MTDYCVYAHINKLNGKIYIGITNNIQKRWGISQYKYCPILYKALKKYGWDNFIHLVIIDNITKAVACECEKALIAKYQTTNPNNGYNLTEGGTGGATRFGENHPLSKKVYRYDLDGNYLDEWINAQYASRVLNIQVTNIHQCARGEVGQAGQYQWSYEYYDVIEKYEGHWGHSNKKEYPRVYQISLSGELVKIYDDIHVMEGYSKKQIDKIRECCTRKRKTAYGYLWLFEDDYLDGMVSQLIAARSQKRDSKLKKQICVYNLNGELIDIFKSKDEASIFTGIKPGTIQHMSKGYDGCHRSGDYLFYYYDDTNGNDVDHWLK